MRTEIFNEAWRIARIAHKSYNFYGSVNQYFDESLKLAYKYKKVACLTLKQQLIVKNCLSSGARLLNFTFEYLSDTTTRVYAETMRGNNLINKTYLFDHNNTYLTKIS